MKVKCSPPVTLNVTRISACCSLTATRETSFVHAISAAGVMYTLARNCSLGDIDSCGCDVSRNGKIGEFLNGQLK